jgi:hypothetical protein
LNLFSCLCRLALKVLYLVLNFFLAINHCSLFFTLPLVPRLSAKRLASIRHVLRLRLQCLLGQVSLSITVPIGPGKPFYYTDACGQTCWSRDNDSGGQTCWSRDNDSGNGDLELLVLDTSQDSSFLNLPPLPFLFVIPQKALFGFTPSGISFNCMKDQTRLSRANMNTTDVKHFILLFCVPESNIRQTGRGWWKE